MNTYIMAKPERCIACRTCEIACAMAHGEVRLEDMSPEDFKARISLLKSENISIPLTCRQCEDARCVHVCPQGALRQHGSMVETLHDKCIGCKSCVIVCPYGVIRVTARQVERPWKSMTGRVRKAKIVKCDLCSATLGGPACVQVCPTNVLRMVGDSVENAQRS